MEEDPKAGKRMRVILDHLSGRVNATEASVELGISRKTFYEWLERGRMGMFQALKDRPTGRPPEEVDPEKESLQGELRRQEQERQVLEARLRIQEAIRQAQEEKDRETSRRKKKPLA